MKRQLSENLTEAQRPVWSFFDQSDFVKPGFFPHGEKRDVKNPRCSKFGGSLPTLGEFKPKPNQELLMQVHIPALPVQMAALFPEALRESTIAIFYDTEEMESMVSLDQLVINPESFDAVVYVDAPESAKIEPFCITDWEENVTINDSDETFFEKVEESGLDSLDVENFGRWLREEHLKSYTHLGGYPRYEQGEIIPEGDYSFFANLEDDEKFSMMWGDDGSAQLWVKSDGSNVEFWLSWQ